MILMFENGEYFELDKKHVWHPWTTTKQIETENIIIKEGAGCYVTSLSGKRYLDAKSAVLNASCGYRHPKIVNAIAKQLHDLMNFDLAEFSSLPPIELAKKLADILPAPLERTFFCSGGSEATETAMKIARMYFHLNGKKEKLNIISFYDGYHGTTLGTVSASHLVMARADNGPLPAGFHYIDTPVCPFCKSGESHEACHVPPADQLESKILELGAETVAAFIMEPVLGLGGIVVLTAEYVQSIRQICDKYNILLIFDETMTSIGRTGKMFGFEHFDVVPDILVCGKGISGSYFPLSTITTSQEIYYAFNHDPYLNGFRHGHTNSGHSTACAAGLATIETIEEENLVENARVIGDYLLTGLKDLQKAYDFLRNARGRGLILGIDVDSRVNAVDIYKKCLDRGLIIRLMGQILVLIPPLILNRDEAEQILSTLNDVLAETTPSPELQETR